MNLTRLFETQKLLDERIVKKFNLEGKDLLPEKILALQVELGELANEHRGFKFWSKDQEPRMNVPKGPTMNYEDIDWHNPVLEEYVDCLHFLLSIGNDLGFQKCEFFEWVLGGDIIDTFRDIYKSVSNLHTVIEFNPSYIEVYEVIFSLFVKLGEKLGFTWDQIEQAYIEKNIVNHQRQESGY